MEEQGGVMTDACAGIAGIEEYEKVFEQYLDICNQAIEKNMNTFPYMQIWRARWKGSGRDNILRCAVYDDRPKVIYTLELTEDLKIRIIEKSRVAPKDAWPLKYSYLKHVVDHPQDYIDRPASLDWGWLDGSFI